MPWTVDLLDTTVWATIGTIGSATVAGVTWFVRTIAIPILSRLKKMDAYCDKLDVVYKELTPNGGGSLKDQVTSTCRVVEVLAAKHRIQLELDKRAAFETDEQGIYRWVNKSYCRATGYTTEEIEQNGWKSLIHPDDRARVTNEWNQAVSDKRDYHQSYRLVCQDDKVLNVIVEASPLLDTKRNILGYLGIMTVIQ